MHVIRHDYVSAHSDVKIAFSASNVFLEYLMNLLQIADFSAMKRANRYEKQRTIISLKYDIEPGRPFLDHLGEN